MHTKTMTISFEIVIFLTVFDQTIIFLTCVGSKIASRTHFPVIADDRFTVPRCTSKGY